MALTGQQLLDYACEQFENGAYDAALEAFILAYEKGYEKEWVLENIYSCYMAGNEAEFQKNYAHWNTGDKPKYEGLTLDFIPYREGEYYIYDKETQNFRGIFSIDSVNYVTRQENFRQMEFSALALAMHWDWSSLPEILAEAGYHKVYSVCQDMNKCASFFKIPELTEYAKNIMLFPDMEAFQHYFHEHTSEYLPKLCVGTEEGKKRLLDIINQEHTYRLTPEGRNTDNVLLTIGIPTHDRGNLLLKRLENLIQMPYDAEVEFAISKHGTLFYQDEYRHASEIVDARINYDGYDKELTMTQNWRNVVKIAHGRYVMMVSDEDDVIVSAMEHYLNLLNSHNEVGLVRSRTMVQYSAVCSDAYYQKGEDAFFSGLFLGNYLSGTIYNKSAFMSANIEFWEENFSENKFYHIYPHVWWQAILAFEGDYVVDSACFIQEGESVSREQVERYINEGVDVGVAEIVDECQEIEQYATYGERIKQFQGAAELIWDFDKLSQEMKARALYQIMMKTLYLMHMVCVGYKYKPEEYPEYLAKFVDEIIKVAQQWKLDAEWQKKILNEVWSYVENYKQYNLGNC